MTQDATSGTLVRDHGRRRFYVARRFARNRGAIAGAVGFLLIVAVALAAPWLARHDPVRQSLRTALQPPSATYPLGTDQFGRDIYSRLVHGARISLRVGLVSVGIALVLGTPLGLLAGYYRGVVDSAVSRFVDIVLAFPAVLLALAIMAVLGPSLTNAMIAVGVSILPQYVRVARASTLSVAELDYVVAARAVGASDVSIIARHVLPNVALPLVVLTSLQMASAVLFAASLSFLGLGAQPPTPEWGAMLTTGRTYMRDAWWIPVFPGLAITLTVLSLNLLGDGLRDALDPRHTRAEG
jgi:peptide/nickel transport system permease protein